MFCVRRVIAREAALPVAKLAEAEGQAGELAEGEEVSEAC